MNKILFFAGLLVIAGLVIISHPVNGAPGMYGPVAVLTPPIHWVPFS